MDQFLRDLITESGRVLFLAGVPIVLCGAIAGTLIAAIQSSAAIHDSALRYAARILAVLAALYFIAPLAGEYLVRLAELSLRAG